MHENKHSAKKFQPLKSIEPSISLHHNEVCKRSEWKLFWRLTDKTVFGLYRSEWELHYTNVFFALFLFSTQHSLSHRFVSANFFSFTSLVIFKPFLFQLLFALIFIHSYVFEFEPYRNNYSSDFTFIWDMNFRLLLLGIGRLRLKILTMRHSLCLRLYFKNFSFKWSRIMIFFRFSCWWWIV